METPRGLRFQAFEKAFRNDLGETIVEIMAGTPGYLGSNRSEDLELHEEVEKAPAWPRGWPRTLRRVEAPRMSAVDPWPSETWILLVVSKGQSQSC